MPSTSTVVRRRQLGVASATPAPNFGVAGAVAKEVGSYILKDRPKFRLGWLRASEATDEKQGLLCERQL